MLACHRARNTVRRHDTFKVDFVLESIHKNFTISMTDLNFTVKSGRKLRLSSSSDESDDNDNDNNVKEASTSDFIVVPQLATPLLEEPSVVALSDEQKVVVVVERASGPKIQFATTDSFVSFPSSFARVLTAPTLVGAPPPPRVLRSIERSLRAQFSFAKCRNAFKFDTPPPAELRKAQTVQHKTFV
jgi:hypothetical protein